MDHGRAKPVLCHLRGNQMRDMKCRVWDPESKKMTYLPTMIVDDYSIGFTTKDEFYVDINNHHPTAGLIVTWFTGLKAKSGVDIYEGDIVERELEIDDNLLKYRYVVTFKVEPLYSGFFLDGSKIDGEENTDNIDFHPENLEAPFELIGNIYENKELLK